MSRVMNCVCRVYGDMQTECLAPGDVHLALHQSMAFSCGACRNECGGLHRLSLESLATRYGIEGRT